jgi:hypothetical protein
VTRDQIVYAYTLSIQRVWAIGLVFVSISFLVAFWEKEVALHEEVNKDFALKKVEKDQTEVNTM